MCRVTPIVDGIINNEHHATFLVDTGSFASVFSLEQVAELGLHVRTIPPVTVSSISGPMTIWRLARLEQIRLGSAIVTNVDAVILDHVLPGVAGVVGVSLLSTCALLVDATHGNLAFLSAGEVESAVARRYPGSRWSRLQLQWFGKFSYVELPVRGHVLRLFVDTGSSTSELLPGAVASLRPQETDTSSNQREDVTGDHGDRERAFNLDGLELGKWTVEIETLPFENPALSAAHLDGILGFDVLRQVPFVFDGSTNSLWVMDPPERTIESLRVSEEGRAIAWFQDPFPAAREFAAVSAGKTGELTFLPRVATLLQDDAREVREAAAAALSTLVHETWQEESLVADAIDWWDRHKREFTVDADTPGNHK